MKVRFGTSLGIFLALLFLPVAAMAAVPAPPPAISAGDTAWMLTSTALVLMMTIPGLALFYGGLVRKQNMLAVAMQSFATCSLVAVIWAVVGYSLAFTNGSIKLPDGSTFIGDFGRLLFSGAKYTVPFTLGEGIDGAVKTSIPEAVYMTFQMTFAIITPALITGAFADRVKFSSMLVFLGLWSVFVYSPIAHWVWDPAGFLFKMGVLDYAGGTVVHLNAGIAGLVAAIIIGKKVAGGSTAPAYNPIFALIGASLLWVGWIGFNAGSAIAADGRAAMACATTIIATAMSAVSWMAVEWMDKGRPSVTGKITGAVAGLVAITPASGFVDITGALAIGFIAGVVCYLAVSRVKKAFGVDDSLDCFYVHGVGGTAGAILTGFFAVREIGGDAAVGSIHQVVIQLAAIGTTIVWCGVITAILLKLVDLVMGLRVHPDVEKAGLDTALHGEQIS